MSQYIFFKWSPSIKDQFYERSKLEDKHKAIGSNVMETILQEGNDFINKNNQQNVHKREIQFEQMNQREMIIQKNLNPFLSTNYLEDLQIQEDFLTPQNSNLHNK
tara:strand:+ start:445 stop:759 length:315 start_codon:yes stop_codon:yes gene_type:complete